MRNLLTATAFGLAGLAPPPLADSQSSNTSSNSSSNNGVVRERVVDRYCENGYCTRSVTRRTYRDDRGQAQRKRDWRAERHYSGNDRDDDDDDD